MLLFGHIGVTLGVFFGFAFFIPQLRTIIDPTYLVIGSLLPDLIDKPLGMVIFSSTIANGRIIAHTLLFSFTLFLTGLYLYDKSGDIKVLTLATGSIFHLMEDKMWASPRTLFWPLLGWRFRKNPHQTGLKYLLTLFKKSFREL
ncbi:MULTISPECIES: metal-dependent hydrolase [unclassified Methanosarcina]|uniref:metal-dependent hydrolase n=1 Tax=unclassified Methanosarcina TaxID=2644672 RepID=UPI00064E7075|nr:MULTISPECIES: metal-dependent hydrolase [unclassified Methanosarcina]